MWENRTLFWLWEVTKVVFSFKVLFIKYNSGDLKADESPAGSLNAENCMWLQLEGRDSKIRIKQQIKWNSISLFLLYVREEQEYVTQNEMKWLAGIIYPVAKCEPYVNKNLHMAVCIKHIYMWWKKLCQQN